MIKLVSSFVFASALLTGLFLTPIETQITPTFYEKVFPTFSRQEADSMLGRRIKNKFFDDKISGWKYSLKSDKSFIFKCENENENSSSFVSEKIQLGETGQVIALDELDKGYLLIIKWDKQDKNGRDLYSYDGRFSSRLFLEFE